MENSRINFIKKVAVGYSGRNIDPENGHIQGDKDPEKLWGREYEPGWELKF